jgi:hypothetical protein
MRVSSSDSGIGKDHANASKSAPFRALDLQFKASPGASMNAALIFLTRF